VANLDDPWTFLEYAGEVWAYVVGQVAHAEDTATTCATIASQVDIAWIRRVLPEVDSNRSRWPTDPVWQVVQAAPFTAAPTKARRLMRREQHVHAVEQLDAGAYGYLISRTALLHPNGEPFDVSKGLRGLVQALTKISAQPEKGFAKLVRQRRRKRGLPVVPAGKVLPFLPERDEDNSAKRAALDVAAERMLQDDAPADELSAARLRLAEQRMAEALSALDQAGLHDNPASELMQLKDFYAHELAAYEAAARSSS